MCCVLLQTIGFTQNQVVEDSVKNETRRDDDFRISGYIQTQFQYGEKAANLRVGSPNTADTDFYRFGIRRGRIKLQFEKGVVLGVLQIDATEKGIGLKDAYIRLKDPWVGSSSLKVGVFNRPFGYEVAYSSSKRETPERAKIIQTLFPDERDLGLMGTFQAPRSSPWSIVKLEIGVFAGNGIHLDTDNRKDFMGHLSVNKVFNKKITLGGGMSYYYGGVYQGTKDVYSMLNQSFVANAESSNKGKFAKREYFGWDLQLTINSLLGKTHLYGEYIVGTQPSGAFNSKSPHYSSVPTTDTYIRNFSGGYVTLVQGLGQLPLAAVVKFEWYDPNTKIAKNDIGVSGTGVGDVFYQTIGFGLLWQMNNSLNLQIHYDWVQNERSMNVSNLDKDLKDNVFTLRLQYVF